MKYFFSILISFALFVNVDAQTLQNRGAAVPFATFEAENASTNATVLPYSTTYKTDIQSEASGRRAVKLQNTNDYVQFTLTAPANALVLRYTIPNSDNATFPLAFYINNAQQSDIALDSKHSWVYGSYPYNDNSANGNAHKFWEEKRIILSQTYPANTTFKFQKNSNCNAAYYCIDLIETEQIAAATAQPANSISVSGYSTLQNAVDAAINQNKILFIPEGEKNFPSGRANVWNSLTVQGAGVWRSVISGAGARFYINSSADNITFKDFTVRGAATYRIDNGTQTAFESDNGHSNITVDNVWVEYFEAGFWFKNCNNLQIKNCRIRNTFADGINLNNGCTNAIVEHNSIRNTGDDGIALWSTGSSNNNNKIRYNTVSLPSLANGIAIYGGYNNEITNNLLQDMVFNGGGITVGTDHSPVSCTGTIKVLNNTLLRCGSLGDYDAGALWVNCPNGIGAAITIEDNDIYNSRKQALLVSSQQSGGGTVSGISIPNILVKNNVFNTANYGVQIFSQPSGSMTLQCNTFTSCNTNISNQSGSFSYLENNSDCEPITPPIEENIYTIKIKVPNTWTSCYAYIWGTSEIEGGWSGKSLSEDENGFYVYTVDFDEGTTANLIFNNGTEKIEDIQIHNLADKTTCWQYGSVSRIDNGNNVYNRSIITCATDVTGFTDNLSGAINIFPNPTTDFVTIENIDIQSIKIYNIQGINLFTHFEKNYVNLSSFSSGIYFLKITDKNGKIYNQKIIKKSLKNIELGF